MKILFVNTFYYPNMEGGTEQVSKNLAEGMLKNGHQVAVYSVDAKDNNETIEEINGVTLYRRTTGAFNLYRFSHEKDKVGKIEKVLQKCMVYYNRKPIKDFKEICLDFKPDIIHTNSLYAIPNVVWKTAKKLGIPVVHTIHDTAFISPVQYGHKVNPIVVKIHRAYKRYYAKYVDGVTAPSEYTFQSSLKIAHFENAKIKKCVVNSVDLDIEQLKKIVEEKKKRTSKHIKFMYAGRLIPIKGITHMVEAFEKLEYDDCELCICGGGSLEDYVKEKAESNPKIKFCGKLNNQELAEKYTECDVLIVPSNWPEPFGLVVIEGCKYGMPVIAAKCGGIPEIINQTKGGELYSAGNVDELAEKMAYFTDRNVYADYMDSAVNNLEVYSFERYLQEFEDIYANLTNKN